MTDPNSFPPIYEAQYVRNRKRLWWFGWFNVGACALNAGIAVAEYAHGVRWRTSAVVALVGLFAGGYAFHAYRRIKRMHDE